MLHSLLRFRLAAQTQERLALEIEQILLGNFLFSGQSTSAQDVRQLLADHCIVFGYISSLTRQVNPQFQQGESALAGDRNIDARRWGDVMRRKLERRRLG